MLWWYYTQAILAKRKLSILKPIFSKKGNRSYISLKFIYSLDKLRGVYLDDNFSWIGEWILVGNKHKKTSPMHPRKEIKNERKIFINRSYRRFINFRCNIIHLRLRHSRTQKVWVSLFCGFYSPLYPCGNHLTERIFYGICGLNVKVKP